MEVFRLLLIILRVKYHQIDKPPHKPKLIKRTISKETEEVVKDYMLGVVENGTGSSAYVEGYDVYMSCSLPLKNLEKALSITY